MPAHETIATAQPASAGDGTPTSPPPRRSSLTRHHVLGMAFLLLTVVPAYLASRPAPDALDDEAAASVEEPRTIDPTELEPHIRAVADRYGVSPRLVAAIIEAESEFNPRAVSRKGARGLMQLMPATASSLSVEDSFDPYANIEGGVRHLRRLMDRFDGNLPLVLAAYNAGERKVVRYRGVPPYRETRRYVKRIMRRLGYPPVVRPSAARPSSNGRAGKHAIATAPAKPRITADVLRSESAPAPMVTSSSRSGPVSAADVVRGQAESAARRDAVPSRPRSRGLEGP